MTIELFTDPIIREIRQKSHLEVQDIADPAARDNARAGLDKIEEIRRCMEGGVAQVRSRCIRFLSRDYSQWADDAQSIPESYIFEISLSQRRGANKAEPLTAAMHDLIVQYALARFYSTVNQTALSNTHSMLAIAAGDLLSGLLFTKQAPMP